MKNLGKNFIIAFLTFLAIYQTGELWFGDISNHNFFSLFSESRATVEKDTAYTLDRLVINLGDNKVVCKANGIYESSGKKVFDKAVSTALSKGTYTTHTESVNWDEILRNRCIIYEYNCGFKGNDLSGIFNVSNDNMDKIALCSSIIIIPAADSSHMSVLFCASSGGYTSVDLTDNSIIGRCFEESSDFGGEEHSLYYISSVRNGFTIFSGNKFLPRWQEETYEYAAIEPRSMLTDSSSIESNANIFFDNPAGKNTAKQNNTYIFSDDTAVVKYYDTGVLEYSNYKASDGTLTSFSDNYVVALNTIASDRFVTNQYYLDGFDYDGSKYTFRFNYKLNDLSVVPGEDIKKATGMDSFIEVSVTGGRVDRYRKYAYRYIVSQKERMSASVDFINAVDGLYSELYKNGVTKPVDDISLCYIARSRSFGLSWIVNIEGNEHIVAAGEQR